jgi:hypothetical protein
MTSGQLLQNLRMPTYTTWFVVLLVQLGAKEREVRSPGTSEKVDAERELDQVRAAMKGGGWVDLPWFSASADNIIAAYLDSSSVGFY